MEDRALPVNVREFFPIVSGTREPTDEDLPGLHYDCDALAVNVVPGTETRVKVGDKSLVTIYGRWLRVRVTNKGVGPVGALRVFVMASVF